MKSPRPISGHSACQLPGNLSVFIQKWQDLITSGGWRISKRFAKKQQMQWSKRGAHDLLQARVRVLNDELRAKFAHWYPGCGGPESEQLKLAASLLHTF